MARVGEYERDRPRKRAGANAAPPDFVAPMLAKLAPRAPRSAEWLHEIKFDGYRLQARIDAGDVTLRSRRGLDWTDRFGAPIAEAFGRLKCTNALIDGEVVVENESGLSAFSMLVEALSRKSYESFVYWAFDLLFVDGEDLRDAPLADRKRALKALLGRKPPAPLRFSEDMSGDGEAYRRHACRLGFEGVVSKLSTSRYRSGRSGAWVKSKCVSAQEFVIAGYAPSTVSKDAVGALALGVYEKDGLRYVGRVGTGFTQAGARELARRLEPLETGKAPFAQKLSTREARAIVWVKPRLVAEIEFRAWTRDGILRQASFKGLREDKQAKEVVAEDGPLPKENAPSHGVRLTHADRVYWPDLGVTKRDLVDYYGSVWEWIEPHVIGRPLSLLRCMEGVGGQCFFQKQPWKGHDKAIHVHKNAGPGGEEVLAIADLDGLVALAQSGALEIHPWGCRLSDMERADMLTLDLDPGPGVSWRGLADAAREVRDRLSELRLGSFVKTTGGKGLHVVAPLKPAADWDAAKDFAHALAGAMAADSPDRFVSVMTKSRRDDRIFVDYLRNGRGATAVAAYSTRAREGAPVATPIAWEELRKDVHGSHFNLRNLPRRLSRLGADPWEGFFRRKQKLPTIKRAARRN
jgi:bifunctional non-homologous end joining protein LigD